MPHVTISSTISSTMAFNVAKIASARASLTISLTKSLRVAGPLVLWYGMVFIYPTSVYILHITSINDVSSGQHNQKLATHKTGLWVHL